MSAYRRFHVAFGALVLVHLTALAANSADVPPERNAKQAPAAETAASKPSLYAYANPLSGVLEFADHTWVADYPAPATCPNPAASYWYSTGDCHPSGSDKPPRPLAHANANLAIAKCIAEPNVSTFDPGPATALIRYAIDGVCHQIADRILAATAFSAGKPITVAGAHGYFISRFVYGVYGTSSQWDQLRAKCSVTGNTLKAASEVALTELAKQAGVAPTKVPLLREEQALVRKNIFEIGQSAAEGKLAANEVANKVNDAVNASLDRLAKSLTDDEFQHFFEWKKGQPIVLANPEIAARVRYSR